MGQLFNLSLKRSEIDTVKLMKRLGLDERGRVQRIIDSEVLRLCDPYVPLDTGELIRSGQMHTQLGSGEVIYSTPYARRQYYIPMEHKEGRRCDYWFEHMKNEGGKEKILRAAKRAVGGQ